MIGCEGCKQVVGTPLVDGEWKVVTCKKHGVDVSYKSDSVHQCHEPKDVISQPEVVDEDLATEADDEAVSGVVAPDLEFEGKLVNIPEVLAKDEFKHLQDVVAGVHDTIAEPKYRTCEVCGDEHYITGMVKLANGRWLCNKCNEAEIKAQQEKDAKPTQSGKLFAMSHPTAFINTLKNINTICEECRFHFSPQELKVVEMDPSHVAMLKLSLPYDFFDDWNITEEFDLALNVKELLKLVGKVTKSEEMEFWHYEDESKVAWVKMDNGMRIPMKMHTLESMDDEVPEPKIFFKAKSRIITSSLYDAVMACTKVSEHIRFDNTSDFLKISATGDIGDVAIPFEKGCDALIEVRAEEDSSATYTTSYLTQILKSAKLVGEAVTIELSTDMPLKIDVEMSKGQLWYFLAPCIGV
jgi:proliferating cell nuclear antigen PCNA